MTEIKEWYVKNLVIVQSEKLMIPMLLDQFKGGEEDYVNDALEGIFKKIKEEKLYTFCRQGNSYHVSLVMVKPGVKIPK